MQVMQPHYFTMRRVKTCTNGQDHLIIYSFIHTQMIILEKSYTMLIAFQCLNMRLLQ